MRLNKKSFYLTTTLPYVNADLHMGHALEFVRADIIVRYKKLQGFDVFFNTGTDEHGMKIYEKAQDENLTVLVHTGFGLGNISAQIKEITDTFPKLKLILGHSAFVDMENTIKKVGNKENVLFETSTVKIFDLFELLERVDYHKIAFGSDLPYYDIDLALEMVIDSAVILKKTPHQIKHILGLNIMKWFK